MIISILAPKYTEHSAGIVALYKLYKSLVDLGDLSLDIRLMEYRGIGRKFEIQFSPGNWVPAKPNIDFGFKVDLLIVPEVLSADVLPPVKTARYYLNKLGVITSDTSSAISEFRIAFSPIYIDEYDFLLPQYLGKVDLYSNEIGGSDLKFINSTYFGKLDAKYGSQSPLPTSILITRNWPEDRRQYLDLLRHSDFFFSFDAWSSTNLDAVLLGAKLVLLDFDPFDLITYQNEYLPVPFLTQKTFNDPNAVAEYSTNREIWIDKLRGIESSFDEQISDLTNALKVFMEA